MYFLTSLTHSDSGIILIPNLRALVSLVLPGVDLWRSRSDMISSVVSFVTVGAIVAPVEIKEM